METSIFLAKLFGITYLSIAAGMILSKNYYTKKFESIMNDASYFLLGGMMSLVAGISIIHVHNVWVSDWTVMITIFGWLALIKGIALLVFPKSFDFFKPLLKANMIGKFLTPVALVMGLIFTYFGFMV